MNVFHFLREMAGEIPYERRAIKGHIARQHIAAGLVEEERQDWLKYLEAERPASLMTIIWGKIRHAADSQAPNAICVLQQSECRKLLASTRPAEE